MKKKSSALATAEQIADHYELPAKPIPDYTRLNREEVAALLKLHEAGKTQVEIAQVLGCSQPTVSEWLSKFSDTRQEAIYTLRNGAQKLAERIVREADVDQSLEVLDRLEVAMKRDTGGNRTAVQINIGSSANQLPDVVIPGEITG